MLTGFFKAIHGVGKQQERKELPSCVVSAIRRRWPSLSGQYTGFSYSADVAAILFDDEPQQCAASTSAVVRKAESKNNAKKKPTNSKRLPTSNVGEWHCDVTGCKKKYKENQKKRIEAHRLSHAHCP